MSNCSGIKQYIRMEDIENEEYRLDEFVKSIKGALIGREDEEYSVQNFAFIINVACNKVSDLFKKYEDIVVTSDYVLPLSSENEAYAAFEDSVFSFYSDYENGIIDKELLYRKLVIAYDYLTKSIKPKEYVKTLQK